MLYKVFLVEDEIVTREGIRDNVNWNRAGFIFCGEASDGELALPLIQSLQPDLLITDIKMPFMDGLRLSRLVRASMPNVRIVILSGHDEFEYARTAISLGVCEYLLKPLGVRELEELLARIRAELDAERMQEEQRRLLEEQVELDLALRRDRFLLRLLTVGASPEAALEEARGLGCTLGAFYQVVLIRSELVGAALHDFGAQEAYHAEVETFAPHCIQPGGDWLILRKDIDESVLVAVGATQSQVEAMSASLLACVARHTKGNAALRAHTGRGEVQMRLHQLNRSYTAALYDLHDAIRMEIGAEIGAHLHTEGEADPAGTGRADSMHAEMPNRTAPVANGAFVRPEPVGSALVMLHRAALADFLRTGLLHDFDAMFDCYMGGALGAPLDERALQNPLIENYVRTDMALTIAKFVIQLGENPAHLFAELGRAARPGEPTSIKALQTQLREACAWALDLRDHRALNRNVALVQRAQQYIQQHSGNPSLSLAQVAAEVGLSPNHFSAVFSAEAGETFRDYLSSLRIVRARELLRSTSMTNSEISEHVGYADPHYFGAVFKRMTGYTPQQYRTQPAVVTSGPPQPLGV